MIPRQPGEPGLKLIAAISGHGWIPPLQCRRDPRETLIDIIVHGQDIAISLERHLEVPTKVAAFAATQLWSYQTIRKVSGKGPEIRGPILAIPLLLTGRTASYAALAGPGTGALRPTPRLTGSA